MWLQNNFKLVMIGGLVLILGLSFMEARQTHKQIKKGEAQWLLKRRKINEKNYSAVNAFGLLSNSKCKM